MKSDLEVTIKAIDSKHMEVFPQSNRRIPSGKKWSLAVQHIGLKNRESQQAFAKQKRLLEIWFSFDHRENDLLNQEIRIIRALDELIFFFIDDNETKLFENSAEISISDYPELFYFDFFHFLKRFDFSSIPIFVFATFQK